MALNCEASSPIQLKFELHWDFMPVLITCCLMEIEFRVTEKRWVHHFLHHKSMGKKVSTQGRKTAKWIILSGPNSNSFELLSCLCLSLLPASLTNILSKVTEKSKTHHFFHNSRACNAKVTGQIRSEFKPSNNSCLSLLPVSLMKIKFIVTENKSPKRATIAHPRNS